MSLRHWGLAAAIFCAVAAANSPAWGVIERPLPLKSLVGDSDFVVTGRVKELDPNRPSMVIEVQSDLKGKATTRRLAVLLKGEDGKGENACPRLAVGLAVVGFITINDDDDDPKTPNPLLALLYFEGTWVQLQGTPAGENYRWQFTHVEPYLRRTFSGRSSELAELVTNALAEKTPWPDVQTSMKPGLGPTIGEEGNPPPTTVSMPDKEEHATTEPATTPDRTTLTVIEVVGALGVLVVTTVVGVLIWKASSQEPPPRK